MSGVSTRAIDTAKAVLAKCNANDPWFPKPSEATVLAWAEQFALANLPFDDLVAAVTAAYSAHEHGFRPLPADIMNAARGIRRERAQRLTPEERAEHEERIDRKASGHLAEIVAELAEAKSLPGEERTVWPPGPNPLRVGCPWCKVGPGERCRIPGMMSVLRLSRAHPARVDAAKEKAGQR